MECFAHSNSNAIGVCKSCGKGVCRVCAISVTRGLACSAECKPFAESLSKTQLAPGSLLTLGRHRLSVTHFAAQAQHLTRAHTPNKSFKADAYATA